METFASRRLLPGGRALARVVTLVALAVSCLTVAGMPAGAANLEQHNPVTYNMQGASADTTPKWSSDIPNLLNHDVIALQEAGPLPPLDPNGVFSYQDRRSVNGMTVYHYLRNFGTRSRPNFRHVYFMQTDPTATGSTSRWSRRTPPTRSGSWGPPLTALAPRSACNLATPSSTRCTGCPAAATTCRTW